jgi:hypothetical protein
VCDLGKAQHDMPTGVRGSLEHARFCDVISNQNYRIRTGSRKSFQKFSKKPRKHVFCLFPHSVLFGSLLEGFKKLLETCSSSVLPSAHRRRPGSIFIDGAELSAETFRNQHKTLACPKHARSLTRAYQNISIDAAELFAEV